MNELRRFHLKGGSVRHSRELVSYPCLLLVVMLYVWPLP